MKIKWAKEVKTPKQDLEVQLNLMLTSKKKQISNQFFFAPIKLQEWKEITFSSVTMVQRSAAGPLDPVSIFR